jgi:hypothetical protein
MIDCRVCAETGWPEYFMLFSEQEKGEIAWDKAAALAFVEWSQLIPVDFNLSTPLAERLDICEEHLPHVDMSKPVFILLDDEYNEFVLFDGNHRIARAQREDRATFPAYVVTMEFSRAVPSGLACLAPFLKVRDVQALVARYQQTGNNDDIQPKNDGSR